MTGAAAARAEPERLGRPSSPVFVGRDGELARVIAATSNPPALVLVEGEPGVGKTRLLQELIARHERARSRVLLGRCHELSEPFPLGPLLEAFRGATPPGPLPPVTGALRPLLPELADHLPDAPAALGDPAAERHRLFRGLLELIAAFGPMLLLVEDLHWADRATLEFLRFLVVQPPPGLAVVGTYRREDLAGGSPLLRLDAQLPGQLAADRIALAPFSQDEVRELVRTILDTADVSSAFAGYLFERTAGLPLALEEVLLLLQQRRDLVRRQGVWVRQQLDALAVPPRLRDAIVERLARLSPQARALVQAAAVLSLPADEQLLARVAGLTGLVCVDAIAESLSQALLFEAGEGRYALRHALAQQAVEAAVPAPLRRRLHLRAARALEARRDKPLAGLAHHYRAAGETAKWVRYAEAAADRAVSLQDDATAYALLREAVFIRDLAPVTRGRLAVALARHAAQCRMYEDAIAILAPLLDDGAIPVALRGQLRFLLGRHHWDIGDPQRAHDQIMRALEELDEPTAAEAMSWLAVTPSGTESMTQRLRWLDRAMQVVSASGNQAMKIEIAATRTVLLIRGGEPAFRQAIDDLPQPGDGAAEIWQAIRAYANIADALLHIGHQACAEEYNLRATGLARTHAPSRLTVFESTAMQADWLAGRWAGLEQRIRDQIPAQEDWPILQQTCRALLGLLLLAQGRTQQALELLTGVGDTLESDIPMLGWVAAGIGRARLAEGSPDAALAAIEPSLRAVGQNGIWASAAELAPISVEAMLAAGRHADAAQIATQLGVAVAGRDAPAASAALATCRGLLAEAEQRPDAAAALFRRAAQALRLLPRPYAAANATARAGRCLLGGGDVEQGRTLLDEALVGFRDLGAEWDAALVRHTLRRHGLVPPHRRGRRAYGSELSPREAEVARLASQGLHNREIARALHLSVKTVEGHLSSASRKLGVSSRRELSGFAALN
jgi:DNA-binding CsgD family transcriptional regulator